MEFFLELFVYGLGWLIYGTPEKPRHPAFRHCVRLIALTGLMIAYGSMLTFGAFPDVSWWLLAVWVTSLLVVVIVENDLGSRGITFATIGASIGLVGLALWLQVE